MALVLNDAVGVQKAATGPNPTAPNSAQVTKNTTGYAQNQGVSSPAPAKSVQTSQPAPTPIGASTTYDYSSDPILQMTMGQQQLAIDQAQAQALAQQKQALIAYGDPNLAMAVLGDQGTAQAAAANPNSTLAQLAAANAQTVRSTNETENQNNLFYSSDRGYKLGLDQQAYLANQANAANSVQSTLSGISSNLLAAEQSAYNAEAQAQEDAYNRALANPVGIPTSQASAATAIGNSGGVFTAATVPLAVQVAANKTGGSANTTQGTFSIH